MGHREIRHGASIEGINSTILHPHWCAFHMTSSLVQKEPGKYQYSFSVLHNEQRQIGFDLDLLCQYDQEELDVKGLTKLEFPSHLIKHVVEIIQRRQMVSRSESIMWSTSDSSEPKGLKYHYRVDKNQGQSVDYTFWIQRISDQVTETFSSHYLKTQDKTQLSLSNQHPNDESRCLDWKVNRTENEKYELNFLKQ